LTSLIGQWHPAQEELEQPEHLPPDEAVTDPSAAFERKAKPLINLRTFSELQCGQGAEPPERTRRSYRFSQSWQMNS